jgi:hypothetical protein
MEQPAPNHRSSPRGRDGWRLAVLVQGPCPHPTRAWLHDVTAGGVALICPEPFDPGTPLEVQLRGWSRGGISRPARVARLTPLRAVRWLVACCWELPLSEAELRGGG